MPEENANIIDRSALFILACQSEGLCCSLRQTVPNGLSHGPGTVSMLKKLLNDFDSLSSGKPVENFPEINESLSSTDLLTIAEVVRSSILAFLTPEEKKEHDKTFGFASHK